MTSQLDIFGGAGGARKMAADLPEGFRYESELIGPADEAALLAFVHELPVLSFVRTTVPGHAQTTRT